MYYINSTASESGNYGNPQSIKYAGSVALPDALLTDYIDTKGFALLTVENGTVTAVEVNAEALAEYEAEHPDTPPTPPQPTMDERIEDLEAALQLLLDGTTEV